MVCKYCGNQLSIEDETCPFCGQTNQAVKKHVREMRHFSRQFRQTKSVVLEETGRVKSYIPLFVLIGILALANVLVLTLQANSYEVISWVEQRKAESKEEYYYQELRRLEEEGKYGELASLYFEKKLSFVKGLREFRAVAEAGRQYGLLFRYAGTLALWEIRPQERYELGTAVRGAGGSLETMYRVLEGVISNEPDQRKGIHADALNEIRKETELLLTGLCGFEDADFADVKMKSAQEWTALIERRLGLYE